MCWFVLVHLVAFLVDLVSVRRRPDHDKDLQILLLQHQVRLLQRPRPQPHLTRWEKLTFAVLTSELARLTAGPRTGLERAVLLFKPDLEQRTPLPPTERPGQGPIRRRERLGGLLREYYREAPERNCGPDTVSAPHRFVAKSAAASS